MRELRVEGAEDQFSARAEEQTRAIEWVELRTELTRIATVVQMGVEQSCATSRGADHVESPVVVTALSRHFEACEKRQRIPALWAKHLATTSEHLDSLALVKS